MRPCDDILDDFAGLFDTHARRSGKRNAFFAARDRKDLCKRESLAVKFKHEQRENRSQSIRRLHRLRRQKFFLHSAESP